MEKAEEYSKRHNAIVNYLDENKERIKSEKKDQEFGRYKHIVRYFLKNDGEVSKNANHLEDLKRVLIKEGYKELGGILTYLLSNTTEGKADFILEKRLDIRRKLDSIEASREKQRNLIDQWIGDLI